MRYPSLVRLRSLAVHAAGCCLALTFLIGDATDLRAASITHSTGEVFLDLGAPSFPPPPGLKKALPFFAPDIGETLVGVDFDFTYSGTLFVDVANPEETITFDGVIVGSTKGKLIGPLLDFDTTLTSWGTTTPRSVLPETEKTYSYGYGASGSGTPTSIGVYLGAPGATYDVSVIIGVALGGAFPEGILDFGAFTPGIVKWEASVTYTYEEDFPPIPIPAALPLLLTGLAGLGILGYRRRRT